MDIHGIAPARNSGSQQQWLSNVTACDRPAPDLNIPVHCSLVYSDDAERNPARDFELFGRCCPPVANNTNIWGVRRGCDADCWTYNLDLDFATCVNTTAKLNNHTRVSTICEYVDYEKLGEAVKTASASGTGRVEVVMWWMVVAVVAGVGSLSWC
ncbi:hypothetical protein BDV96DRAFT_565859 [Lophiotrema nucula]|uniref:Uncharacterized protein n=1 Tax=Lophiotrema nucula TaxID=690887 RepID=A0A6A5ZRL2_9PLEO|nr:hypothetical protein BDV96DRAFT_565859 [Lophiotrema nucula]